MQILQLDPSKVQVTGNRSRFGLKPYRVKQLASEIVERGGVMVPVEVEPLTPPVNGYTHRLTAGFYRHAAVSLLNEEQKAGLTLPALAVPTGTDLERQRRQLAENIERESLSPMDEAIAIKGLLDAGVSKEEVRKIFSRPGGRKGNVVQPVSNAFVNMRLAFLELPKGIQTKIHDGVISVAGAYELTRIPADKRETLVKSIEEAREKELEREARDEERIENREAKEAEKAEKLAGVQAELETATEQEAAAAKAVKEAQAAVKDAAKTPAGFLEMSKEEQRPYAEHLAEAKGALRTAEKALGDAKKAKSKAESKLKALTGEKPAKEAKAPKATKAPISQGEVKQAAKKADVPVEDTRKGAESRKAAPNAQAHLANLQAMRTQATSATAKAIIDTVVKVMSGELSPSEGLKALATLTAAPRTKK